MAPRHIPSGAEAAPGSGVGTETLALLSSICRDLKALTAADWPAVVTARGKEAIQLLEQIRRTTTAIEADVLAATETSGMWALDGQRNLDTWLSDQTGTTRSSAGKALRLSKSLNEDLPQTREALAAGAISSDHAQIIAQRCARTEKQRRRLADPARGEAFLIDQAKKMGATKFSRVARSWAIETDPKIEDRRWRKESSKEELSVTSSDDGYYFSGFFNHVRGALIDEALRSFMGRKAADDERPYNERRADAFAALAAQSLTFGDQLPTARIRPHLVVTVDYTTLQRLVDATGTMVPPAGSPGAVGVFDPGEEKAWVKAWQNGDDHAISTTLDYSKLEGATPATLPDGTPIPHKVLARLACESMLTRVVFGPDSTVLNVGREQRIFTKPQVRAIIARDRTCRYPGCEEGPSFGEIHHTISWARHKGNTDVDLGILLCYRHHDHVHERDITITRHSGRWVFINRSGDEILPPDHAPRVSSPPGARSSPPPGVPPAPPDDPPPPPGESPFPPAAPPEPQGRPRTGGPALPASRAAPRAGSRPSSRRSRERSRRARTDRPSPLW